ncbi:DUF305 domain-containing protein [Nocardia arizonensis]|uniref:DUF305 domain-containing protein n=1 Tax=Nocardia arizonensis TaxID=1141647 RepID=UPI0006D0301B|nr:DUF305 domain-containing protein [Nocardia arizonensis]
MVAPRRGAPLAVAAAVVLALTLVVLGAAMRPVVLPEKHTETTILTAIEIGFAQDMTAHHQQALLMTQRLAPDADPAVRRLAQQVSDTQRTEIGTMLGWLRLADAAPMSARPMAWMDTETHTAHHRATPADTTMPGMATTAELDTLAAATGRDAALQFLRLMIRHHEGGVSMAAAADTMLASGAVKEAARAMLRSQTQEIGIMSIMLTQLGG